MYRYGRLLDAMMSFCPSLIIRHTPECVESSTLRPCCQLTVEYSLRRGHQICRAQSSPRCDHEAGDLKRFLWPPLCRRQRTLHRAPKKEPLSSSLNWIEGGTRTDGPVTVVYRLYPSPFVFPFYIIIMVSADTIVPAPVIKFRSPGPGVSWSCSPHSGIACCRPPVMLRRLCRCP